MKNVSVISISQNYMKNYMIRSLSLPFDKSVHISTLFYFSLAELVIIVAKHLSHKTT